MEDWGSSSSEYSDEEVGVVAHGKRLWVRGVRAHTTCGDIVHALTDHSEGEANDTEWILAERWRGVERPLPARALVLDILNAWGDARHEVRLALRPASPGEDSGRDSPRRRRRRRRPPTPPAQKLVSVIQHQSRTIHQQIDKLREQEKLIDQLEDQTHRNRMEKHGTNYLLESYLRDLGRSQEQEQAGNSNNSDSGVGGGSGTPPRRHIKHKSRRERQLMREHYFTKELTDICQINSERITQQTNDRLNSAPDTDSENSLDELVKMREEIELLEKMAIINKRLHREEELIVRLGAKVKRYTDENEANSCESISQITVLIDKITEELTKTTEELDKNAQELEQANNFIEDQMKILDELTLELESEDLQSEVLERELFETSSRKPLVLQDNYVPLLDETYNEVPSDLFDKFKAPGYSLDTLV